jgi:hypothetical protein
VKQILAPTDGFHFQINYEGKFKSCSYVIDKNMSFITVTPVTGVWLLFPCGVEFYPPKYMNHGLSILIKPVEGKNKKHCRIVYMENYNFMTF